MWEITKDYINELEVVVDGHEFKGMKSRVGHEEQHSRIHYIDAMLGFQSEPLPGLWVEVGSLDVKEMPKVKFRTKDDDGEVYYEGWLHDDDDCANQEAALKFAETDVGCTTIEVYREGEWVQEIG